MRNKSARHIVLCFVFAALSASRPLHGIVTAGPPENAIVSFGQGLDGVANLMIDTSTASFLCSGALLETGRHVLTAAHCVTDMFGNPDMISFAALFETPDLITLLPGSSVVVHPDYMGDLFLGADLAVVTLAGMAPPGADRYSVYRATDEIGQAGLLAGYGVTGQGKRDLTVTPGQRRAGRNRFDADGAIFDFPAGDGLLLYDFDNGRAANDGFGFFRGRHDLGEGADEVLPAAGDSGGPTFLGGSVAGIHSFVFRQRTSGGLTSDIDSQFNQSFGEFGADVRLSKYADWIDTQIQVPEPSSWAPMLMAAILLVLRHQKITRRDI